MFFCNVFTVRYPPSNLQNSYKTETLEYIEMNSSRIIE